MEGGRLSTGAQDQLTGEDACGCSARHLLWADLFHSSQPVAIIATAYCFGLTPGHVFERDDFAAYVMHAANIVEGWPYSEIHCVPNRKALWVSPANGYPLVYPLLLAPVYWRLGLDLRAMKMITVGTFVIFLVAFALWVTPLVSPALRLIAVMLMGLSPAFWSYRDLISSEFPYLISFLALLAIRSGWGAAAVGGMRAGRLWLRCQCMRATGRGRSGLRCRLR